MFTDTPLKGNPVAVFGDGMGLSDEVMQRTARELNLSETVFVMPAADRDADVRVRIFTPAAELPFAGHPVLGTAFVLGEGAGADVIRIQTGLGVVPVALRHEQGIVVEGVMDQPIPTPEPISRERELLAALGVERSELPVEGYRNGPLHVYVALPSEQAVANLRPNLAALEKLGDDLGCSCFCASGRRVKTRMFAPALGVPEDPATGSAAGPLALHLIRHGRARYGQQLEIHQGAEIGRPSLLRARVEDNDGKVARVLVGGSAVIVARGEYRLE